MRHFRAQRIHFGLERIVKHVADHGHAALGPLSHAAELRMIELRLAALSRDQCHQEMLDAVFTDAMAGADVGQSLAALFSQLGQSSTSCWARPTIAAQSQYIQH